MSAPKLSERIRPTRQKSDREDYCTPVSTARLTRWADEVEALEAQVAPPASVEDIEGWIDACGGSHGRFVRGLFARIQELEAALQERLGIDLDDALRQCEEAGGVGSPFPGREWRLFIAGGYEAYDRHHAVLNSDLNPQPGSGEAKGSPATDAPSVQSDPGAEPAWETDDEPLPRYVGCDFKPAEHEAEICARCGWNVNRHSPPAPSGAESESTEQGS